MKTVQHPQQKNKTGMYQDQEAIVAFRVSKSTRRLLRLVAADRDVTLQEVACEALREFAERELSKQK